MTTTALQDMAACSPPAGADALGIAHPRPFWATLTVQRDQVSRAVDHASNVQYVAWLDRAAEMHADSLGFTRAAMLEMNRMWFVARHEIDYLAETWPGNRLAIATWVRALDRAKSWRDSLILRPEDERVICRASTLWVWVNLDNRRPTRVTPEMAAAFEPLERVQAESTTTG